MDTRSSPAPDVCGRVDIPRAVRLHWVHWLVVLLSVLVTLGAWHISQEQLDARNRGRFDLAAERVIAQVTERMTKYEDGLWGGVGAITVLGGYLSNEDWFKFAQTLSLGTKYPGINGIGVIFEVAPEELPVYLEEQRRYRPDFLIFPPHDRDVHLPITYIEPVGPNLEAVGLDIAHETTRYRAAVNARDTGRAQITGPIVLVQDTSSTPGFLFYAPFYWGGPHETVEARRERFAGMVYAPFVVRKLLKGTLDKAQRRVGIRIVDARQSIYDELMSTEADFDPDPMFKRSEQLDLYGRTWSFDIWSSKSFKAESTSTQPLTILIGGILIDCMLLGLFVLLSRANQSALRHADSMTQVSQELQARTLRLERSNADLEQFAYVASHDLQEPLRMVGNFVQLLQRRYEGALDEKARTYIGFAVDGVRRMQQLLDALMQYSRLDSRGAELAPIDSSDACQNAIQNLRGAITESGALLEVGALPRVIGDEMQLAQLFQNLIGNAIKFRSPGVALRIQVRAEDQGDQWCFAVTDNGIGIATEFRGKVFDMFQRLHDRQSYPGDGVGLAVCQKVVARHGGRIWVESGPDGGSRFRFTLRTPPAGRNPLASPRPVEPDGGVTAGEPLRGLG